MLNASLKFLYGLFFSFTAAYLVITILSDAAALCRMDRDRREQFRKRELFSDGLFRELPVSILIPAHNEEASLCAGIRALLRLDYPAYEIVVVNDGSTDRTLGTLLDSFPLKRAGMGRPKRLAARPVSAVYRCTVGGVPITVLDKSAGGKADALNAGINFCRYAHFAAVDADTVLPRDAMKRIAFPFLVRPETVACGGAVYTSKEFYAGARVNALLLAFQKLEYLRAFYGLRLFFDRYHANLIVSGAFGMFDRDTVARAGGYDTRTVGEDMELILRLHAYCRLCGKPYAISYAPDAVCVTQFPLRIRDFCAQRRRWQTGLIQSLKKHRNAVSSRYFGALGLLTAPVYCLYELAAPMIESLGILTLLLSRIAGVLDFQRVLFLTAGYAAVCLLSSWALALGAAKLEHAPVRKGDLLPLLVAGFAEIFFFHFLYTAVRVYATLTAQKFALRWEDQTRSVFSGAKETVVGFPRQPEVVGRRAPGASEFAAPSTGGLR